MRFELGPFRPETASPAEVLRRALTSARGRPFHIVTFNSLMYLDALRSREFAAALEKADLLLAESSGMALAAKFLYNLDVAPVAGIDMITSWLDSAGLSFYFLGGRPGAAERAARTVARMYPKARVAGFRHGYFSDDESAEAVSSIAASGAEILLAGLGSPRQEIWLSRNIGNLGGVKIAVGVGGALDVLAGDVLRAPAIFRRLSVEWLWRLVSEPRRAPRIARLPLFAFEVLKLKLSLRRKTSR